MTTIRPYIFQGMVCALLLTGIHLWFPEWQNRGLMTGLLGMTTGLFATIWFRLRDQELERAELLAEAFGTEFHKNQKDKAGVDYFWHLFNVAERCKSHDAKIVAWLHDSVEDGHTTLDRLVKLGFLKSRHIRAINLLTQYENENRHTYIIKIKENKIAREVKIADLTHNMKLDRFTVMKIPLTEKHIQKFSQYQKELELLQKEP